MDFTSLFIVYNLQLKVYAYSGEFYLKFYELRERNLCAFAYAVITVYSFVNLNAYHP